MFRQRKIKIGCGDSARAFSILEDSSTKKLYVQEERSIEEIVNEGDRDFLDFVAFDYGRHLEYPSLKYIKRQDHYSV